MAPGSHSAAPSAIGYLHQTRWGLVALLEFGAARPDAAITLELHDDVAWEVDGSPTELLQIKHHQNATRSLTDSSTDTWRTLKAWMDTASPGDAAGPDLVLITTQVASDGSAMAALREETRNEAFALARLESIANESNADDTRMARDQFLALGGAHRAAFVSRIRVVDGSPHVHDISERVRRRLDTTLPTGHEDVFMSMVWRWWDEIALAMLQKKRRNIDMGRARASISDIRDQFTPDSLPTFVELRDLDQTALAAEYGTRKFVHQMRWVAFPPVNLAKAVVDYYRAYSNTVRWLDEDLIGTAELQAFSDNLVDEWEREFEWMLETIDGDADENTKQEAGRNLLRALLGQTGITVRARYDEPFFAKGKRHELADEGRIGWHPDFETKLQELLSVAD